MPDIKEQIQSYNRLKGNLKAQLTTFQNLVTNITETELNDKAIAKLNARLTNIETKNLPKQFCDIEDKIAELKNYEDVADESVDFENLYIDTITSAKLLIKQFLNPLPNITKEAVTIQSNSGSVDSPDVVEGFENESNTETNQSNSIAHQNAVQIQLPASNVTSCTNINNHESSRVKLPTLQLPTFDGSYDKWLEFHDTFNALIHLKPNLSKVEKFYYLKTSLKLEAAEIINSLEVTCDNYDIAWQLLKERFQNNKLIIHNHIHALFNLETMHKESYVALRSLIDNTNKHLRSLKILQQPIEHWDTIIIYVINSKLDATTRKEWETHNKNQIPTWSNMSAFLKTRCDLLETITKRLNSNNPVNKLTFSKQNSNSNNHYNKSASKSYIAINNKAHCVFCSDNHYIYNCKKFHDLPVKQRINEIRKMKLCNNCLRKNHLVEACKSNFSCKKCNRRHNTLIHEEQRESTEELVQPGPSTTVNHSVNFFVSTQVLLSTALVNLKNSKGQYIECRALLDSGSQSNFLSEKCCKELGLSTTKINYAVKGINQSTANIQQQATCILESRINGFRSNISCLVIPKITDPLPAVSFDKTQIKLPKHIILADPSFNQSGEIDLLLGSEIFWKVIRNNQFQLGKSMPTLHDTQFGWVVAGDINLSNTHQSRHTLNSYSCTLELLDARLKSFWEIENVDFQRKYTPEEQACEDHFVKNTFRDSDGRFVVTTPLKHSLEKLGNSRTQALNRFLSLERQLSKNHFLKIEYTKVFNEYLELGHMREIIENSSTSHINYYLPHHAIVKKDHLTTKIRVVFDASAKTDTGISYNDIQLVSPTIQDDIYSLLLRFRKYRIALTADIEKMYRQVKLNPNQHQLQRILWRNMDNEPLKCYELNTVTFGMASAPFLAIRCLKQVALDNQTIYPTACESILNDFYVDDLLTGANNITDAISLKTSIELVLNSVGFKLRKWQSNEKAVLNDDVNNSDLIQFYNNNDINKTLGVTWDARRDTFQYTVKTIRTPHSLTKRAILSTIAQIYDPLGILSPIIITAKIIMQELWLCKLSWDESLPDDILQKFINYSNNLAKLNTITIPRFMLIDNHIHIELHGFCDSSEKAYGSCIYIKSTDAMGNCIVNLVSSKSKVAPIKNVTLPRLELCAAVTLAKLVAKTVTALKLNINKTYLWSDSTITLNWLKSSPLKWKTFVANRVTEIQNLTTPNDWYHVKSLENPADLISRGTTAENLLNSCLWWHGPEWLTKTQVYPINSDQNIKINISNMPEVRKKAISTFIATENYFESVINNFSSYERLLRVVSYCRRYVSNLKSKNRSEELIKGPLTVAELNSTLLFIVKTIQNNVFHSEILAISKNKPTKITSLNPFIDNLGILRVGGRLGNSCNFSYDKRFPILLPNKHRFTEILLRHEHIRLLHCGPQLLIASIRERFWPLKGRGLANNLVHKCITCFKAKPKFQSPIMGDLPESRISPAPPFFNCGVDYAGPFLIKDKRTRGAKLIKSYICLFVCFATKAIHLELVTDLSSETFLAALRRFTARRGKPSEIYSDNATNFVGTMSELKTFLLTNFNNIQGVLANESISWHFIPPRSPHFGGLWEAGVKSVKSHLKRILSNSHLTFEEFYSVITQVEAVVNSRPLAPLSTDPNDPSPLTPAHFLIGRPLTAIPTNNLQELRQNHLSRWERIQQLTQHFWQRWNKEYVSELQIRSKWKKTSPTKCVPGALVLLKEDNLPPMKWLTGRISDVYPGKDKVVRVISVQLPNGKIVKRAVTRVCVLPIDTDLNSN